ncbi:MAG: hypothetical protein JEZ09_07910 [Salinivirgaceae bacterium]|nr:hypothetical protein [Salinivirgaceae bacterium]
MRRLIVIVNILMFLITNICGQELNKKKKDSIVLTLSKYGMEIVQICEQDLPSQNYIHFLKLDDNQLFDLLHKNATQVELLYEYRNYISTNKKYFESNDSYNIMDSILEISRIPYFLIAKEVEAIYEHAFERFRLYNIEFVNLIDSAKLDNMVLNNALLLKYEFQNLKFPNYFSTNILEQTLAQRTFSIKIFYINIYLSETIMLLEASHIESENQKKILDNIKLLINVIKELIES